VVMNFLFKRYLQCMIPYDDEIMHWTLTENHDCIQIRLFRL